MRVLWECDKIVSDKCQKKEQTMAFNGNSKLKDVLANPEAKAVLEKYLPGMINDPQLKNVLGKTLKNIAGLPKLKAFKGNFPKILEELAKIQ
jgi:hypothetical protein